MENLKYKPSKSTSELVSILKVAAVYVVIAIIWYVTVAYYGAFGRKWISVAAAAMWGMGYLTSKVLREESASAIKSTKLTVLGYLLFMLLYLVVINKFSTISSEELALSYNINIPAVSTATATNALMTIQMIASVMTPIGYLVYCAQKFRHYHAGKNKKEAFESIKDSRKE